MGSKNRLREVLNRLIWTNSKKDYIAIIVSRGYANGTRSIPLGGLIRASKDGFIILIDGYETYIPYHRVLRIESSKDGTVVYRKGSAM